MMVIFRNILAVFVGLIVGSAVNMFLITVGPIIIPPPEGVDVTDMQSLSATMHLFEPRHFVFPFVAHALGTFTGSLTAFFIAASYYRLLAYVVGLFSFAGGVAASTMIPAPVWFNSLDLLVAYFPMVWLAVRVGHAIRQ